MNEYAVRVAAQLRRRYAHEPEYLQCVLTWLEMIDPALDDPRYEKLDLLTRMVEPERMFTFLGPHQPRLPRPVQQRHRSL